MAPDRRSRAWSVVRVASGNFLEMYDFMIGQAFFPGGTPFASLMLALMSFGAGQSRRNMICKPCACGTA
jgi:hypothetical protein